MERLKPKLRLIDPQPNWNGEPMFRKLTLVRPTVVRKGDTVKVCHYFNGTKQCLGPRCFWPKVGKCPIYNKIKIRVLKAK